jgi:hypothetical protein
MIRRRRSSRGVILLRAPEPSARRVRCPSSHALQAATTLTTLRSTRQAICQKKKHFHEALQCVSLKWC